MLCDDQFAPCWYCCTRLHSRWFAVCSAAISLGLHLCLPQCTSWCLISAICCQGTCYDCQSCISHHTGLLPCNAPSIFVTAIHHLHPLVLGQQATGSQPPAPDCCPLLHVLPAAVLPAVPAPPLISRLQAGNMQGPSNSSTTRPQTCSLPTLRCLPSRPGPTQCAARAAIPLSGQACTGYCAGLPAAAAQPAQPQTSRPHLKGCLS